MSTKSRKTPVTAPAPRVELTPEQKAAQRDAYLLKSLNRLISEIREAAMADNQKLIDHLSKGYVVNADLVKRLAHSQAMAAETFRYFPAEIATLDLPTLVDFAKNAEKALRDRIMTIDTGNIDSCGEINSTCSMTRSFGALAISARSKLAAELGTILFSADWDFWK